MASELLSQPSYLRGDLEVYGTRLVACSAKWCAGREGIHAALRRPKIMRPPQLAFAEYLSMMASGLACQRSFLHAIFVQVPSLSFVSVAPCTACFSLSRITLIVYVLLAFCFYLLLGLLSYGRC